MGDSRVIFLESIGSKVLINIGFKRVGLARLKFGLKSAIFNSKIRSFGDHRFETPTFLIIFGL